MRFSHSFFAGLRFLTILSCVSVFALADNAPAPKTAPKISKETREQIAHAFDQELIYIRASFPMGKVGLKLKDGTVTPTGDELQHLIALWGPAVKPGDRALISDVIVKDDHIRFEINGGPVKKQKWYQHIQVSGANSATPITPSDAQANAHGSYVDLYFDKYVPEVTGPELKQLLRPVFDFDSKSAVDAYLETVSPQVKEAIKSHHVLVGMNHEMVIYAKGRPPKRVRERADDVDYEEWIFGESPQDVDFVRFVGDEVVRVETMRVGGEKIVRVEKEVDVNAPTVARKRDEPRGTAPTLRRPGEEVPDSTPSDPGRTTPIAPPDPPTPPGGNPGSGPNWASSPVPAG